MALFPGNNVGDNAVVVLKLLITYGGYMSVFQFIKPALVVSAVLSLGTLSAGALAIGEHCGEAPQAPEVVDGASVTMDELVANSEQVKAFIDQADAYLDCREAVMPGEAYQALSRADKRQYRDANREVLDARNKIGDSFNQEVAEFQKANP